MSVNSTVKKLILSPEKPMKFYMYKSPLKSLKNTHETDNLLHIKDNYKKILITGNITNKTEIDGIEVIYVVDWLLQ